MSKGENEGLGEIEIRLTFLDDEVSRLADVDLARTRQLQVIERSLADMRSELRAIRHALGHDARDEPPPPHY